MSYVFDNSPLSALFRNYYRKTFPSLWQHFDQLVADGRLGRCNRSDKSLPVRDPSPAPAANFSAASRRAYGGLAPEPP